MGNDCLMLFIILCFSSSFMGLCRGEGIGIGEGDDQPPCFAKILACTLYLHQSTTPPPVCCGPVKQLVSTEAKCYCDVFSNAAIMITLNVTQADGIGLAKSCGSNVGSHFCKNAAAAPRVSPSPTNSTDGGNSGSNTNSTGNAGNTPPTSAASLVSKFGVSSILVILFSIISMF